MAINFPTSLDNFTNPASGNTLDSPSHSLQHSDINDAVEALEAKVGIGASPAGSATAGQVLTAQGGGTALWATPAAGGLVLINTTSFSGVANLALNDNTFSATYQNYKLVLYFDSVTADASIYIKMRAAGTDSSTQYNWASQGRTRTDSAVNSTGNALTTGWKIGESDAGVNGRFYSWVIDLTNPFLAQNTLIQFLGNAVTTAAIPYALAGGGFHEVATSYDSVNIIMSSGNMSGKVSIYGYKL